MNDVIVKAQGSVLQVELRCPDLDFRRLPKRGGVTEFSRASRMRLLRLVGRLEVDPLNGYRSQTSFLTLTMQRMLHPRLAKHALGLFFKSLRNTYPTVSAVWRMEYQKRGAVHFHLMLFNTPYLKMDWLRDEWSIALGEREPIIYIKRVYSKRSLMGYVGKYVAKVERVNALLDNGAYLTTLEDYPVLDCSTPGRVWGVFNRKGLPYARQLTVELYVGAAWGMIKAYCRTFWPWISGEDETGFTVFCDDPYHALNHIRKLNKTFD